MLDGGLGRGFWTLFSASFLANAFMAQVEAHAAATAAAGAAADPSVDAALATARESLAAGSDT